MLHIVKCACPRIIRGRNAPSIRKKIGTYLPVSTMPTLSSYQHASGANDQIDQGAFYLRNRSYRGNPSQEKKTFMIVPENSAQPPQARENQKKLRAVVLSCAFRVVLPDISSLKKRSEPVASTPEDKTFLVQKDLTTQ